MKSSVIASSVTEGAIDAVSRRQKDVHNQRVNRLELMKMVGKSNEVKSNEVESSRVMSSGVESSHVELGGVAEIRRSGSQVWL